MVILLDTHIAYWLIVDDKKMPAFAKRLLSSQGNSFYWFLPLAGKLFCSEDLPGC